MTLSQTIIKATAESYTRDELVQLRKDALAKLQEIDYVSSASTGAGASYSISQRAKIEDLIELYSAAIEYLDNGTFGGSDAAAMPVVFY